MVGELDEKGLVFVSWGDRDNAEIGACTRDPVSNKLYVKSDIGWLEFGGLDMATGGDILLDVNGSVRQILYDEKVDWDKVVLNYPLKKTVFEEEWENLCEGKDQKRIDSQNIRK